MTRTIKLTAYVVSSTGQIQGELQTQIMAVLWKIGEGTVEQVRTALPSRYRSAYTTIQTVLNRLAARGILERERRGNAIVYKPVFSEAEYLSRTVERTLAAASLDARDAVLAHLVGQLSDGEVDELRRRASEIEATRRKDRP